MLEKVMEHRSAEKCRRERSWKSKFSYMFPTPVIATLSNSRVYSSLSYYSYIISNYSGNRKY